MLSVCTIAQTAPLALHDQHRQAYSSSRGDQDRATAYLGLFQSITGGFGLLNALRTRQIDQNELSACLLLRSQVASLDADKENTGPHTK